MGNSSTPADVMEAITGLVIAAMGTNALVVDPDDDLTTTPGLDSVRVMRIIAAVERRYDIELEDEQVFSFRTIRNVADSVEAVLKEREAGL